MDGDLALVLLRISQDDSRDARSLDTQRASARRDCRTHGWTYGREYEDTASASEFGAARGVVRDSYNQLLADIPAAGAAVLIVASVSRTARDIAVLEGLRKLLVRHRMRWCIGGRVMNPAEPGDTMLILLEGIQAQAQTQQQSKDILRGVREARAAGRAPAGRCPFGYHRPPRQLGQRVVQVPHPVNGPLVRWGVVDAVPSGESLSGIASRWAQEGQPGILHGRAAVRKILLNPALLGMTVHRGELIRGDWEPIVSPEELSTARDILSRPERKSTHQRASTSLLSSIARCHRCEVKIQARYRDLRFVEQLPRYHCPQGGHVWPMERIDTLVELEMFAEVHAVAQRAEGREQTPLPDPRADAAADLAAAEARYAELNDQWHSLGLTLPEYAAAVRPLREAVVAARQRVASARPAPEVPRIDPAAYPAAWSMMTLDQRRAEVRRLLTVTLVPGGSVVVESAGL